MSRRPRRNAHKSVQGQGGDVEVGRLHVCILMREMGHRGDLSRAEHAEACARSQDYPYLLRNVTVTRPNQAWATDISYIPMARGFVYLAAVVD